MLREENFGNVQGIVNVRVETVPNASHRDTHKQSSKVEDVHCTPALTPRTRYPPVTYSASNLRRVSEMSLALFWKEDKRGLDTKCTFLLSLSPAHLNLGAQPPAWEDSGSGEGTGNGAVRSTPHLRHGRGRGHDCRRCYHLHSCQSQYLITGQAGPEVEREGQRWRRSRDAGRRADALLRRPILYSRLGLEAGSGPQPGFPFASCSAPPLTFPAPRPHPHQPSDRRRFPRGTPPERSPPVIRFHNVFRRLRLLWAQCGLRPGPPRMQRAGGRFGASGHCAQVGR